MNHMNVSFFKSAIRLAGCLATALTHSAVVLALFFAAAEFVGILEELVDKRKEAK